MFAKRAIARATMAVSPCCLLAEPLSLASNIQSSRETAEDSSMGRQGFVGQQLSMKLYPNLSSNRCHVISWLLDFDGGQFDNAVNCGEVSLKQMKYILCEIMRSMKAMLF